MSQFWLGYVVAQGSGGGGAAPTLEEIIAGMNAEGFLKAKVPTQNEVAVSAAGEVTTGPGLLVPQERIGKRWQAR